MDTNTKIIIDVQMTSEDATKKAQELGKSIKAIKEEQAELKKQGKENDVAYQSNAANLRALTHEQKAYIQMANNAEGSNLELSAQLTLLTQQYNALSREERTNTVAGQALAIQIKGISDELKASGETIGDHRRSVGDYEKANRSATAATEANKDGVKSLNDAVGSIIPGYQTLTDQLSRTQSSFTSIVSSMKESNETMKAAKDALKASEAATKEATAVNQRYAAGEATLLEVQTANTAATNASIVATEAQAVATVSAANASRVLQVALASTGIGAVIVLAAALVSWLTKFKPLTDAIEQGVAGVSAAFEVLGKYVFNITKPLINVFTSPKKALIDFGNFLQQNIINRFKSFGVIIEGIRTGNLKMLTDGFIQMGTGITGATSKISKGLAQFGNEIKGAAVDAGRLTAKMQDLEDEERKSVSTLSKLRLERDRFAVQAKNTALSEQQRIALLEKATQKEQQAFKIENDLARRRLALTNEEIALDAKRNGGREMSDELQEKLFANEAKVNDLEATSLKFTEKRYNDRAKLMEKSATEGAKMAEKAADAENIRLESLLKTNEIILTERQREVAAVNREIDEKIAKYKQYGATTEQLEKERTARLKMITDDFHKKDLATIEANTKIIQDIAVDSIKDEGARKLALRELLQSREIEEVDRQQLEVKTRMEKGEKGLEGLIRSYDDKRTAILAEGSLIRQQLVEQNYAAELGAFNEQQVKLAEAAVASAGTDAEKIAAEQALLATKYQMEIDHANLVGEDTTLIVAEHEAAKRKLQEDTIEAVGTSFRKFSASFQALTSENSTAYKVAGAIQAKVDAAQALRNNILIIQANIKALAEQGKLPFPLNIVAIFSTLAALGSAVLAAKTLVAPVSLATGGVFESDGRGTILKGPGTGTSDSINARLSNGEAVINAKSTKMFRPLLSMINKAGGGADLAPGYSMAIGGIAQGGFVSDMSKSSMDQAAIAETVIAAIKATPAPIVSVKEIVTAKDTMEAAQVRLSV